MRMIDGDALRDHVYAQYRTAEQIPGLEIDEHLILLTIDNAPTIDAVPVVRCGECLWKLRPYGGGPIVICGHQHSPARGRRCTMVHFCSYGERRED